MKIFTSVLGIAFILVAEVACTGQTPGALVTKLNGVVGDCSSGSHVCGYNCVDQGPIQIACYSPASYSCGRALLTSFPAAEICGGNDYNVFVSASDSDWSCTSGATQCAYTCDDKPYDIKLTCTYVSSCNSVATKACSDIGASLSWHAPND